MGPSDALQSERNPFKLLGDWIRACRCAFRLDRIPVLLENVVVESEQQVKSFARIRAQVCHDMQNVGASATDNHVITVVRT